MDASDGQLNWYLVLFGSIILRLRALKYNKNKKPSCR